MSSSFRAMLIPSVLAVLLGLFLLEKPVHIDEANFLMLTGGDLRAPHLVKVNWQGHLEPAYDVLSNPAGIAWWLWPVRHLEVHWMRLWMLPWSLLALWGAAELGRTFWSDKFSTGAWLLLATPIFWSAHLALMPDMPLLALTIAGFALYFKEHWRLGALLIGSALLFRYSALLSLGLLWVLQLGLKKQWRSALLFSLCVPAALFIYELQVYGGVHLVHMVGFQSVERTLIDRVHSLTALLAMFAVGAFPLLSFSRSIKVWMVALVLGGVLIAPFGVDLGTLWGMLWVVLALQFFLEHRWFTEWRWRWIVCGQLAALLFLLQLRFAATRYWAPFLIFALLRALPLVRFQKWKLGGGLLLSLLMVSADLDLAQEQKNGALWVVSTVEQKRLEGAKFFSGHWGFQHYLEEANWRALEEDEPVPEGALWAVSEIAWPQMPSEGCWELLSVQQHQQSWGAAVHAASMRINMHANHLSPSSKRSLSPFGIAYDRGDRFSLWRSSKQGSCCEAEILSCLDDYSF